MSKIVKYTEFRKVMENLWNRVKTNFVSEVVLDKNSNPGKNILKYTKNGNPDNVVSEHIITEWPDLEYVNEYEHVNLIDYTRKKTGFYYREDNGIAETNASWSIYELPVTSGKTYTIARKVNDTHKYYFFNNNVFVKTDTIVPTVKNGWRYDTVIVPADINRIDLQFQDRLNGSTSIMAFEGDITPSDFIPYTDGKNIQIQNEISYKFNNSGTNIKSSTIEGAIKELSEKNIESSWGDLYDVIEYPGANLLEYNKRINGKWYNDNNTGVQETNASWSIYELPVTEGEIYTIARKTDDSHRYYYFDQNNNYINKENITPVSRNGWKCDIVTTPTNTKKIGIQFQHGMNGSDGIMIFEGDITPTVEFIPYLDGTKVVVGDKIRHKFNNNNTNLTSTSVDGAIKELDMGLEAKVDKGKNSVVGGKTVFVNGVVKGTKLMASVNPNKNYKMDNDNRYFCSDSLTVFQAGTTRISQITIGIHDSIDIGTIVTGVNVGVAKLATGTTYIVNRYIIRNGRAVVHKNIDSTISCDKAITIDIDEDLVQGDRLMLGANGAVWDTTPSGVIAAAGTCPDVGSNFTMTSGGTGVGNAVVYVGETPLEHFITDVQVINNQGQIKFTRANGTTKTISIYNTSNPDWTY